MNQTPAAMSPGMSAATLQENMAVSSVVAAEMAREAMVRYVTNAMMISLATGVRIGARTLFFSDERSEELRYFWGVALSTCVCAVSIYA